VECEKERWLGLATQTLKREKSKEKWGKIRILIISDNVGGEV